MKKNIRNILLVLLTVAAAPSVSAQTLVSGYFLEGNLQRSMLNPAFAGDHNYLAFPFMSNLSVGTRANVGLSDFLYPTQREGYALTTFMSGQVDAEEFLSRIPDNTRLSYLMDYTMLAAGFRSFGGYTTLRVGMRAEVGVSVPKDFFAFAKQGLQNSHYSLSGLRMNALAYGDIALGHSHPVGDNLTIGATAHLLVGGVAANVAVKRLDLDMNETSWRVESELAGQVANYGSATYEETPEGTSNIEITPGLTSFGFAADLGAAYNLDDVVEGLRVSAALTDLGFLGWSNSLEAFTQKSTFEYSGFGEIDPQNLSFEEEIDQMKEDLVDMLAIDFRDGTGFRSTLSPLLTVGAEYDLPACPKLSTALLLRQRFGTMTGYTDARLYLNAAPLKWLDLAVNVGASSYGTEMGWMLNIHPRVLAFFVGSDCMVFRITPQFIPVNHCNTHFCMGMNIPF